MEQEVEKPVRPVLIPLLQGKRPQITPRDQLALARWAWKTGAMVHLLGPRDQHAVAVAEYRHFMQHRRPPSRAIVWVGQYDPVGSLVTSVVWAGTSGTPEPKPDMRPNDVYIVNFTIGPVFFSVFGTSNPICPPLKVSIILAPCVRCVWPVGTSFAWPPGKPVTGHAFTEVAVRLGQIGPRLRGHVIDEGV